MMDDMDKSMKRVDVGSHLEAEMERYQCEEADREARVSALYASIRRWR